MNRRSAGLGLAALAAIGGLGLAVAAGRTPATGGSVLPPLLGVLALLGGAIRARQWLGHHPSEFGPAERGNLEATDVPGDAFDRMLGRVSTVGSSGRNSRLVAVRQSLREAAIDALVHYRGFDRAAASEAVDDGTWTDDRYAAEFFTTPNGAGTSVAESVTGSLSGDDPFGRRAAAAAAAIEELTRGDEE